jgi:hypothetical protein
MDKRLLLAQDAVLRADRHDSGVGLLDSIVCCSLRIATAFRSHRLLQRCRVDRQLSQAPASCREDRVGHQPLIRA